MNLTHIRHTTIKQTVIHDLYKDGTYWMSGIENRNTLIKTGTYKMSLRKVKSGLWTRYDALNTDWFEWFLMLDVPGRLYIYEHSANYASQIRGCIAHGQVNKSTGFCGNSLEHMRLFYEFCVPLVSDIEYQVVDVKDAMEWYVRG